MCSRGGSLFGAKEVPAFIFLLEAALKATAALSDGSWGQEEELSWGDSAAGVSSPATLGLQLYSG